MTDDHGPGGEAPSDAYREYFERSADAFLIIDGDRFVDCNQACVDMLGYGTREEVLEAHPSRLSPPLQPDGQESFAKANVMMETAFAQGSHRFEWDHLRADGTIFPVEVLLTAVRREGRPQLHVVWRELTRRRTLERELRQAQKMEALGRLSGGIAHDFNNLLVSVIGRAELIGMDLPPGSDLQEHVDEILKAGKRAADLVRQLLAFSRKQWLRPEPMELNAAVADLRGMLERLLGENIRLDFTPAPSGLWIKADPGQMGQVLVNLAVNARDAMPAGGRLSIATQEETDAPPPGLPAGRYVRLTVSDTGEGMDPAIVPRIFEPFFTTKDQGRGTGLGLATVYGIVHQSGGAIAVDSGPGRGAVFTIRLPLLSPPPAGRAEAPAADPREHAATLAGDAVVLVVEDEAAVARLAGRILERAGYTVLLAADGVEALEVMAHAERAPRLVLTDVIMPRLGGAELACRLRETWPGVRVLFMSGYTADKLTGAGLDLSSAELVGKPFKAQELLAAVRRVLDAG